MNDNTLTEHPCGSVTLSCARKMVCLEAAWEAECLAGIVLGLASNASESVSDRYAVRGISDRIRRLVRVLIGGLGDKMYSTADMELEVFGTTAKDTARQSAHGRAS